MDLPGSAVDTQDILLTREDQQACIDILGATLRSYRVGARDVVVATPVGSLAPGMHGSILAPWPNRLQDGSFIFDGHAHRVPINEPGRHNANHGLVWNRVWQVQQRTPCSVTLTLCLPDEAFGFPLSFTVTYTLDADGLSIDLIATNEGDRDAPVGIGFHPWLSPGDAAVDACTLQVPVVQWLECDERLLPKRWTGIPPALAISQPRSLAGLRIDDGFLASSTAESPGSGRVWQAALTAPDGRAAVIWGGSELPCIQVCTGDFTELGDLQRAGVAVEPMSCPANALVTGDRLTVLSPGERFTVHWGLALVDAR